MERKIKKLSLLNLGQGEFVTVHHGYACEKISEDQFNELWSRRNSDGIKD